MRPRILTFASIVAVLAVALPQVNAPAQETGADVCTLAGYGDSDATYNVGAWSGQYASTRDASELSDGMDPYNQHTKNKSSYGIQSRLTVRALVVRGCDGGTTVLLKNDHYLSQDAVQRRVAQILEERGSSITYDQIVASATHDHSSPYPVTPSWGVWAFQDAFDARMFEFYARRAADAIVEAEQNLRPARMGATEIYHDIMKANIQRKGDADDGTPAGYPQTFGDHGLAVIRFDDAVSGEPIATWVNFGEHPESLDSGLNLISADFLGPMERLVQRDTGAPMIFSQGDVGSSEGPYAGDLDAGRWLPDGTRRAFAHMDYAQAERGAFYLARSVAQGFEEIGSGGGKVPYSVNFAVGTYDGWLPYPMSHPYPSVSNCRTEKTAEGDPGAPVVGLPDCERGGFGSANDPLWENLKAHGIPLPEHYDAPSFTGVEENMRLRLQAVRIGDVLLGSCSCEAQVDIILNFESRANDIVGDLWDGFDWQCSSEDYGKGEPTAKHDWYCVNPDFSEPQKFKFSDHEYDRMQAQIHNDAAGWNDPDYVPFANTEPDDVTQIKGNFTKEELDGAGTPVDGENVLETEGYRMVVGLGHTGDYNGYTVSYREYMARDGYRKALTCCGPHTADYMATNLVYMGRALKGGPDVVAEDPYNIAVGGADESRQVAFTTGLGAAAGNAYTAWYASLGDDLNAGTPMTQPQDIQRFDAAGFKWIGGSNAIDNPTVVVQRKVDGEWIDYADQSGEVQTFVKWPAVFSGTVDAYTGAHEWVWTANFEAFDYGPRRDIDPRGDVQIPEGQYRFRVEGTYRDSREDRSYLLESEPFTVSKWDGIQVRDLIPEENGVSFEIAGVEYDPKQIETAPGMRPQIFYPRTYEADPIIRFIHDDGNKDVCKTCSFRPWAVGSDIQSATVTVVRANCATELVPASLGEDGKWHASTRLHARDIAFIDRGGVIDTYGEINGQPTEVLEFMPPGANPNENASPVTRCAPSPE